MERRDNRRREDTRDHKPRYEPDHDRDRDRTQRSRSPRRDDRGSDDRRRHRSPFRDGARGAPQRPTDRNKDPPHRERSPQPPNRGRNPPPARAPASRPPLGSRPNGAPLKDPPQPNPSSAVQMEGIEGEDEETTMARIMGFGAFKTTKNTKVPGNDRNHGIRTVKQVEYRQYMNRKGGFNRPLSPSAM